MEPLEVIWCATHGSVAEGFVSPCFYALFAAALDKCELVPAEVTIKRPENTGPGLW